MGSSESLLDADVSVLFRNKDLTGLIEILRAHVKKFRVDSSDIIHKNSASPFFSMLYFILRQNKAKDWETGLLLSDNNASRSHLNQYDHLFPKSLLKKENYDKRVINEMANLAFVCGRTNIRKSNKNPLDYFNKEVIPKRGKEAIESQLIPIDDSLLDVKNYASFLEYRRNAIAATINNFMKRFDDAEKDVFISVK